MLVRKIQKEPEVVKAAGHKPDASLKIINSILELHRR